MATGMNMDVRDRTGGLAKSPRSTVHVVGNDVILERGTERFVLLEEAWPSYGQRVARELELLLDPPLIPRLVTLAFDPSQLTSDHELYVLWKTPVARTLWMAIKARFMTSDRFVGCCLDAAARVAVTGAQTVEEWVGICHAAFGAELGQAPFLFTSDEEPIRTWRALWPYVIRQRAIGYEFVPEIVDE